MNGRARRRLRLARYWIHAGDLDEAAVHARHALRLALRGPDDLLADAAVTAARIERDRDRPGAALEALRRAGSVLTDDVSRGRVLVEVADLHRRAARYPQAAAALSDARERLRTAAPLMRAALSMMDGIVAKETGAFEAAAAHYAEAGRLLALGGGTAGDDAALAHNLAGLAHARRSWVEAEGHARRAVALRRADRGSSTVDVAQDVAVLGAALAGQRRFDEARALFHEAMRACARAHPPRRYEIAVHLHNLAGIDHVEGRTADAERRYRQALAVKEELLGPDHPEIAAIAHNLARLLRTPESAALVRRASAIVAERCPPTHPVAVALRRLG
ncbi:hypothetical protein Val02_07070 [Virgisporangium aliadipatigenens]|uniref:Tetratricopeptide repeat protein n=1 Tax=Virgisporangium aliadipatigenens TaxID=741659 RepID=A0A8J3YH20_9ACTN|nr:tetratricopeptide repeat protein [Virgisporangium aliadipatigenens]GIJ43821.1 hypothetical protein Val02_07070 [Virgisporangium aliadipatigenens]